ncbi:MAG: acyltransferase [Clostridia bacterium]|nr:acyltransferase [Clostridia bacterium]
MTERNRFIDIAKGISIILVLFNHYEWQKESIMGTHLYYWIICMAVPVFMLCTGYVTVASFESKKVTLKQAYSKKALLPKLCRYIMPFVWFYVAETILTIVFQKTGYLHYISTLDFPYKDGYNKEMTVVGTILYFFAGGRGQHGTYYFPIIMQIALFIPLVYFIVKKWKWGLWLCFGINLAFEVLKLPFGALLTSLGLNVAYSVYRLLAYRYIFALALGCYLYIYRDKLGKWYKWLFFFAVGAGYIYLINYTSYHRVIFTYWQRTSMIAMLYITPLFLLGLVKLKNVKFSLLENLGKASYHILMVQILYYNFFAPLVWTAPKNVIPNDAVGFVIGLVICLGGGYGYYKLYGLIAGKYRALKNRDK